MTRTEQFLKIFKGRHVLFLENDYSLTHGLDHIEDKLIENHIKYNVIYNLGKVPFEYTIDMVGWYDVIVFQTQWLYDHSNKLAEHFMKSKDKKTFVECHIGDPSWYYQPKGVVHDVYTIKTNTYLGDGDNIEHWSIWKLDEHKASWDK